MQSISDRDRTLSERTYTTRHGTTSTMRTENIGRDSHPESQRAMVAAKIANLKWGANQHSSGEETPIGHSSQPPIAIEDAANLLNIGKRRLWPARQSTVLRNRRPFCRQPQPWGLGIDPVAFRAHLAAVMGKKGADLVTVSPGEDKGGRPPKGEETQPIVGEVSRGSSKSKDGYLRAILRAPESIQDLYRDGLVSQTAARCRTRSRRGDPRAARTPATRRRAANASPGGG